MNDSRPSVVSIQKRVVETNVDYCGKIVNGPIRRHVLDIEPEIKNFMQFANHICIEKKGNKTINSFVEKTKSFEKVDESKEMESLPFDYHQVDVSCIQQCMTTLEHLTNAFEDLFDKNA